MNVTGTIEEVRDKLLKINHNLDKDFNLVPEAEPSLGGLVEHFGPI